MLSRPATCSLSASSMGWVWFPVLRRQAKQRTPKSPLPPQVTTEEDLEIIFSRFGRVTSCDIIRDWKTGDSLCYGFIGLDR